MNLNKLPANGILSFMIPLLSLNLKEMISMGAYIFKLVGASLYFFILYINDISFTSNNLGLLTDTKVFLFKNFEIKDIEDASFVLDIKIYCDRSKRILDFSQKTYINKVLERFNMKSCSPILAIIMKSDKLTINRNLIKAVEEKQMENISHASVVR
jgi:hypothetical protein